MSRTTKVIYKVLRELHEEERTLKTRKLQPKRLEENQMVVCIAEGWEDVESGKDCANSYPRRDMIYHVSGGEVSNGTNWISLEELGANSFWSVDCFRPVKKPSIECFTAFVPDRQRRISPLSKKRYA